MTAENHCWDPTSAVNNFLLWSSRAKFSDLPSHCLNRDLESIYAQFILFTRLFCYNCLRHFFCIMHILIIACAFPITCRHDMPGIRSCFAIHTATEKSIARYQLTLNLFRPANTVLQKKQGLNTNLVTTVAERAHYQCHSSQSLRNLWNYLHMQ